MKTAIITGASRGIGKALALGLAEMDYRVALIATNKEKLKEVADQIIERLSLPQSHAPLIFPFNISQEGEVRSSVKAIYEKTGSIDVLINGAGITRHGTSELSSQDLLAMLEVNLIGALHTIRTVAPYMKNQRSGHIFNISSRAGKTGFATHGGYASSKFGLVGLNESLFNELVSFNIKVTAICPGYVDTDMTAKSAIPNEDKIPIEDIVKTVQFLLSLSPNCCIKEIVPECRKVIELLNRPL